MAEKINSDEATRLIAMVKKSFKKLQRRHAITLCVIFLAIFCSIIIISGTLELLFYLPAAAKIILFALSLLFPTTAVIYLRKSLRLPTFKEFYHQFAKEHKSSSLSDALDLYYERNPSHSELYNAAIEQNIGTIDNQRLQAKLDRFLHSQRVSHYYHRGLMMGAMGLACLIGLVIFQPEAMNRLSHLNVSYSPPNPYHYTIEPGTLTLEQGESFTPKISFESDIPQHLTLAFKTHVEDEFRQRNTTSITGAQAAFPPISLSTNGQYFVLMDGFKSTEYQIRVQLRPRFEQLSVQITPPAYTRLDTSHYTYPFSQIRAYPGSELKLQARSNKTLSKLTLFRSANKDTIELSEQQGPAKLFNYNWKVEATDTLSFGLIDSAGLSNKNKFRFAVEPLEDQYPFVNLIAPSENLQMKTPENISLRYEAGDDFGLSEASLRFELQRAFTNNPEKGTVALSTPPMNEQQNYDWELPDLEPKPRDVITYWIEVEDNDKYKGRKTGRSQKLTISFPSMTEYLDELEIQEEEVTQSLDNISDSFDQMEQEYNQFKEQLKQNPETNWQQKQQLKKVGEQKKKIDKQVDELNNKFESIREEIEKNRAISPETMKAYDELQKLMKEIDDPELAEALKKLQKSLEEMNPSELSKALENYEFNEELYKERIQRTMELFKSLKLNSDLEKMAQSLEELAKQEQELSESERAPAEDLNKQEAVQDDLKKVQEQLEKIDRNAPDKTQSQVKKLQQDAGQKMDQTKKELQKNIQDLDEQKNNSQTDQKIKKQQRRIQQQMQNMARNMRSAKKQINQQQQQINVAALQYILYSLINLSDNQEELTKETENLPFQSQAFVEKAKKERNISNQFTLLSDSLFEISSQIPSFSNQINKMKHEVEDKLNRSVEMLAERNRSNSTFVQRDAMGGINNLSTMIASLLDQIQNQQGGGGSGSMSMQQMMEQMQKRSGQQQKLNQQIQNLINDIQGDRLSRSQMERLNQLSKQQNNIRKQLKKMQRNGSFGSGDRVLSELERMSEEMEDAINDLRGGQLDRQLIKRQQNILSRMLSAEKAIQKRGKEDRREGTTAEEQPQSIPPDLTVEELQKKIRKMLNDPNQTTFSADYQRLIEQYFELLKEQKKEINPQ